jgi:hypothetical protein
MTPSDQVDGKVVNSFGTLVFTGGLSFEGHGSIHLANQARGCLSGSCTNYFVQGLLRDQDIADRTSESFSSALKTLQGDAPRCLVALHLSDGRATDTEASS